MKTRILKTGFAPVHGGELYYEALGEGETILLIHAGVADHRMWDDQFYLFGIDRRVIRYDTRGFGKSRTENTEFSNRQDVVDLMSHIGCEKAHIIGVSRGGQIAVDFAVEFPDRVLSLVPTAAGLSGFDYDMSKIDPAEIERCEYVESFGAKGDYDTAAELESAYWCDGPLQPEGRCPAHVRAKVRQMILDNFARKDGEAKAIPLDPPAAPRLGTIAVPTLVVIGKYDETICQVMGDYTAENIPGARKIVMPGAHMLTMELPVEFNAAVMEFISAAGG